MTLIVSEKLAANYRGAPECRAWLDHLPDAVRRLQDRWSLSLEDPFDEVSCAWVAPAMRRDGTRAVLKLGTPHMEERHEIQALRFWEGDAAVCLLDADEDLNAMLLERCEPGTVLRHLPEAEQDVVVAGILRRLWRAPSAPRPFRPLSAMTAYWAEVATADSHR